MKDSPHSPFPLEGGKAGIGGECRAWPGKLRRRHTHRMTEPGVHRTPIPNPSPFEGEGSAHGATIA
jgi:hypothetical protein